MINDEEGSLDSIRKLAAAQSLVSNVCSNICNSCTIGSLEKDMERMRELHRIQESLMSLTYKSMVEEVSAQSPIVPWNNQIEKKNISMIGHADAKKRKECPVSDTSTEDLEYCPSLEVEQLQKVPYMQKERNSEIMSSSCKSRKLYDRKRFKTHMNDLNNYFSNIHVPNGYDYESEGLIVASPNAPMTMMTKNLLSGNMDIVQSIEYIQRNPVYQAYRISNFHSSSHWSYSKSLWDDFMLSFPSNMTHTLSNDIPLHNLQGGGMVINHTATTKNDTLMYLAKQLKDVCKQMVPFFDLSTAKGRKLPSVSFGWTDNDPNQYKKHRVFICGKKKRPNLITGAHKAMKKKSLTKIALLALQLVRELDPDATSIKKDMEGSAPYTSSFFTDQFANYMCLNKKRMEDEKLLNYFCFDGISIILNGKVAIHEDSGNPTNSDMDQTYSLNTKMKVGEKMWECKSFSAILKKMGVKREDTDATISVSIMLYRKKCVTDFVKRWDGIATAGRCTKDNPIQKYLFDLLATVDVEHNYSRVFHDPQVRRDMASQAKQSDHKQPCFFGDTYRCPESIDRTAYLTSLFDEILCFGSDTGINFTKADIIGTALFMGTETNGTLLMMGCIEIMRKKGVSEKIKNILLKHSMYSVFGKAQIALFKRRKSMGYKSEVWGQSECNRARLPNNDIKKKGTNNHFKGPESRQVVEAIWKLCTELRKKCERCNNKFEFIVSKIRSESGFKARSVRLQEQLKEKEFQMVEQFVKALEKTVNKDFSKGGYGAFSAMNTFQLLAMFDIVPVHLSQYATIKSGLGGHDFCIKIGKKDLGLNRDVTIEEAREWVKSATKNLRAIIGPDLTDLIVENAMCILCRWHGVTNGTMEPVKVMSRKKDAFIARKGRGLQNFYRFAIEGYTTPTLEMVTGNPDCFNNEKHKDDHQKHPLAGVSIIPLTSWGNGKEDLLQWSELEDEEDLSELFDSHLVLDDSLKPAFRTNNS